MVTYLEVATQLGKSTYADHNVWSYDGRGGRGELNFFRILEGYGQYIDKA